MRVTERLTVLRKSSYFSLEYSVAKNGSEAEPAACPMIAIGAVNSFLAFISREMSPVACLAKYCRIWVSMKTTVTPSIMGSDIFTHMRRPSLWKSRTGL